MLDAVWGSFGVHSMKRVDVGLTIMDGVKSMASIYSVFLRVKNSITCILGFCLVFILYFEI